MSTRVSVSRRRLNAMIASEFMDSDLSSSVTSSSVSNASGSPAALDALYDYLHVLTNGLNVQFDGTLHQLYNNQVKFVNPSVVQEPVDSGKGEGFYLRVSDCSV